MSESDLLTQALIQDLNQGDSTQLQDLISVSNEAELEQLLSEALG
jgi:hypothetical protein